MKAQRKPPAYVYSFWWSTVRVKLNGCGEEPSRVRSSLKPGETCDILIFKPEKWHLIKNNIFSELSRVTMIFLKINAPVSEAHVYWSILSGPVQRWLRSRPAVLLRPLASRNHNKLGTSLPVAWEAASDEDETALHYHSVPDCIYVQIQSIHTESG